ncbi:hypothetical protein F5051DRAFT_459086 [Lentinula edodes]|nr:hypothetical protein F5051DRAFT_459086 [Lentinula edodes]
MARGRGFGLSSARGGNHGAFRASSYRGGSWRGRGRGKGKGKPDDVPKREDDGTQLAERFEAVKVSDKIHEKLEFGLVQEGVVKKGWLVNMHPTLVKDADWPSGKADVDYYFIQDDGQMFKCTHQYEPYFYIACKTGMENSVEEWLNKKYEGLICRIVRDRKEDLKLPNHLMGHCRLYLQLCFRSVSELLNVRRELLPLALATGAKRDTVDAYAEAIIDIREYDVPYYLRVAIDNDIRVGLWDAVSFTAGQPDFRHIAERVKRAHPVVMAYDIETTKAPLKFSDQATDQGYLIANREIIFKYTRMEGYEGPFIICNEPNETIRRFFSHIQDVKPTVIATFNSDFFDFPFLNARAKVNGIGLYLETGFAKDSDIEYKSRTCVHMDCFCWGLKAITASKLGYNPIELDPELMTPYALEQPQTLAQYSVSDAVAIYYLYMKYVHLFIFFLCNIIQLNPDELLRKGSSTICETLLMVEAYRGQIIMPNRHEEDHGNFYDVHRLASETYAGAHVEALEAGVFRSDIPTNFEFTPSAVQELTNDLDAALTFCIVEESKCSIEKVTNYEEVKTAIQSVLEAMRDNPNRTDNPLIYHLHVAAMYPNMMLSNRLQPDSIIDESICAVCDYNRPGKTCDRRLEWAWRGEFFPSHRDEYNMIRHALNQEIFPFKRPNDPQRRYADLSPAEQTAFLHKRSGDYSRKDTKVENRESIVCQRENPFYVDTKGLHKTWKKNLDTVDEGKQIIRILNSFYGYVMRKGARWHSMEMAGIICLTALVEQIGRPLELDTDDIWCMLPGFKLDNGQSIGFSYPCTMLDHLVHAKFTNHQYHDLHLETGEYKIHSEKSVFFELDGPYKAIILPSSKEEYKFLKKRYAVFNDDGFEVKRRGELQLIKHFQSQISEKFLLGSMADECYEAVAQVADHKAAALTDEDMSKTLAEYGGQKSTSISDQMVKDKGLACKFIISAKPIRAPVADRAIPESIKRHSSLIDFDLRSILDWNYYIERLGSVIQKLITIPAAMQKVSNPVPRIHHADSLHRRNKLTNFFRLAVDVEAQEEESQLMDIEDWGGEGPSAQILLASSEPHFVRQDIPEPSVAKEDKALPNPMITYSAWLKAMRPRWKRRRQGPDPTSVVVRSMFSNVKVCAERRWDIVQIRPTGTLGRYMLWLSVELYLIPLPMQQIFRTDFCSYEKVSRNLPRDLYREISEHFIAPTNDPNVDGVPLVVCALLKLGCICESTDSSMTLNRTEAIEFDLHQLEPHSVTRNSKHKHLRIVLSGLVKLHIVDPATRKHAIPRLREGYTDIKKKRDDHFGSTSFVYPDTRDFTTTYHSADITALKAIYRELDVAEDQNYIIVLSYSKDNSYFEMNVPKLASLQVP